MTPGQLPPGLVTLQQYLSANAPAVDEQNKNIIDAATGGVNNAEKAATDWVSQNANPIIEDEANTAAGGNREAAYKGWADTSVNPTGVSAVDSNGNPAPGYYYDPNQNPYSITGKQLDPGRLGQKYQAEADKLQGDVNAATDKYNQLTTDAGRQDALYNMYGKQLGANYTSGDQNLDAALLGTSTGGIKAQDNTGYLNAQLGAQKYGTDPLAGYQPVHTPRGDEQPTQKPQPPYPGTGSSGDTGLNGPEYSNPGGPTMGGDPYSSNPSNSSPTSPSNPNDPTKDPNHPWDPYLPYGGGG